MVSDPIADMLARIKNGYLARKGEVSLPWSKVKETIAGVLISKKFLAGYEISDDKKNLTLKLRYEQKQPALTEIRRVSRPSLRIYVNKNNLPKVLGGLGTAIISTPNGIMTDSEARKKKVGGEVICELW